jgi:hypothetical protein
LLAIEKNIPFAIDVKGGEYKEREGILAKKGDLQEAVNLDENKIMRSMVA